MRAAAGSDLEQWRGACLAMPEVAERPSHGTPTFFVGAKRAFVMCWPAGHHGEHFAQAWCAAAAGVLDELLETEPERFFRPPYVGTRGWIGVRFDAIANSEELRAICLDAYLTVAPRRLSLALSATAEHGPAAPPRRADQRRRSPR